MFLCYAQPVEHVQAAAALDALGNPVRLQLYRTLVRAGTSGLNITELQIKVGGIPRSTLAHHLQKLSLANLIHQEKEGASVLSRANYAAMNALVSYLTEECCVDECRTEEEAA